MPYVFGEPEGLGRRTEEVREEEERLAGGPHYAAKEKLKSIKGKRRFLPRGVEEVPLAEVPEGIIDEAETRLEEDGGENDPDLNNPDLYDLGDEDKTEKPIAILRSGTTERSILRGEEPFDDPKDPFHENKLNKPTLSARLSRNPDLEKLPKQKPVSAEPFGWDARKFTKSSKKRGKEKRK